jgi:hypothetical protein
MIRRLLSLLPGRWRYQNLDAYPEGLQVTHAPNPVKANLEAWGREVGYTWWHRTTVKALSSGVRIEEFGALGWDGERWVFGTIIGRPFPPAEFADAYSCPGAFLPANQEFCDFNNYRTSENLAPSRVRWYFVGIDERGRRVKGEAIVEHLAETVSPGEALAEADWAQSTHPHRLLDYLGDGASARKQRLCACACVRRVWNLLPDERSRVAVEVAESLADGAAGPAERETAWRGAAAALDGLRPAEDAEMPAASLEWARAFATAAAFWTVALPEDVGRDCDPTREASGGSAGAVDMIPSAAGAKPAAEFPVQAALVRDVFGNPFRPVALSPAWLNWNGGTIPNLARAAYEARVLPAGTLDPARLGVLADALEEAGCTDAGLLGHLRGPGPHVRGCFAVDLLLSGG